VRLPAAWAEMGAVKRVTKKTIAARDCAASIVADVLGDICKSRTYLQLVLKGARACEYEKMRLRKTSVL
jgi:hypothetical protein